MPASLNDADLERISTRERQRIAHDLHDGLGQLLGGIALKAQTLCERLTEQALPEAAEACELVKLMNTAIGETRLLARALDPVAPAAQCFAATLTKLAADTEKLFRGVTCVCTGAEQVKVESGTAAQHLFRIAQEAINNAIRHGKASRIEIDFRADGPDHLVLKVLDNGTAAKPGSKPSSGIGVRIMTHRANSVGGTLTVEPRAGGGTAVRCRIPIDPAPTDL